MQIQGNNMEIDFLTSKIVARQVELEGELRKKKNIEKALSSTLVSPTSKYVFTETTDGRLMLRNTDPNSRVQFFAIDYDGQIMAFNHELNEKKFLSPDQIIRLYKNPSCYKNSCYKSWELEELGEELQNFNKLEIYTLCCESALSKGRESEFAKLLDIPDLNNEQEIVKFQKREELDSLKREVEKAQKENFDLLKELKSQRYENRTAYCSYWNLKEDAFCSFFADENNSQLIGFADEIMHNKVLYFDCNSSGIDVYTNEFRVKNLDELKNPIHFKTVDQAISYASKETGLPSNEICVLKKKIQGALCNWEPAILYHNDKKNRTVRTENTHTR